MSIQNYSRVERKTQVLMTIALSMQRGQGDELTSYRIARAMGMKPSMHVNRILAEMVRAGGLKCRVVYNRVGRWDTCLYSLPENSIYKPAPKNREVSVKRNGKQVGQLVLF